MTKTLTETGSVRVGMRFGRLVVLRLQKERLKKATADVQCDCTVADAHNTQGRSER
jgi:hypothetical protein